MLRMKRFLLSAFTISSLLFASSSFAAKTNYKAALAKNGGGGGTGVAALTYDDVTGKLCGTVTYQGLTGAPTNAHVHHVTDAFAPKTITLSASPLVVEIAFSAADYAKVAAEETYVNIHTAANPGGEISGDIVPDPMGTVQTCASEAPKDAGTDASSTSSSSGGTSSGGSSGTSSTSSGGSSGTTSSSGGSNGAVTTRPPSETTTPAAEDDGGCSTSGTGPGGGLALAGIVGLALAGLTRGRRRR